MSVARRLELLEQRLLQRAVPAEKRLLESLSEEQLADLEAAWEEGREPAERYWRSVLRAGEEA